MKLILCLFLAINIFAGNERGNGGQSVYIGDNAFLRDIVEVNNCIWHSPELVMKRYPKINDVLDSIDSVHWLTKLRMEEEFLKLNFCFTTKRLPPLSYNNTDDLYIFTNQLFDQPAVNDGGIIFIDMNLFNKMDEVQQAFLFLHEVSHELFDKQEERQFREPRLRQFIMNTYRHYMEPVDTATFTINVLMTKFKYLRSDINNLDEKEIKAINFNQIDSDAMKTNLFFKYRRFIEQMKTTNEYRFYYSHGYKVSLEVPEEELYLEEFKKNLANYRDFARKYIIELLSTNDVSKLNDLNLKELYTYFEKDFNQAIQNILEETISENEVKDYKVFFEKIGQDKIINVLKYSIEKDYKNNFVSQETLNVVTNTKEILGQTNLKTQLLEVYTAIFENSFISLQFVDKFLKDIALADLSKELTYKFILKLFGQTNSFSFAEGILSNEEVMRALSQIYEDVLKSSNQAHIETIKYFIANDRAIDIKNLVGNYLKYYLSDYKLLKELITVDKSLIDLSAYEEVTLLSSLPNDIVELILKSSNFVIRNEYTKIFTQVFKYTYTTKYSSWGGKNVVDEYLLINKIILSNLALYTAKLSKSQKKVFKSQLSDFVSDLNLDEEDKYKNNAKFSTFKSQIKTKILSNL